MSLIKEEQAVTLNDVRQVLEKQGYRIAGSHSAVKICHWTKERLLRKRPCYKAKFYGIESHRCMQITPSVVWCEHKCMFCWRPMEYMLGPKMELEKYDEPSYIIDECIKFQRKLLSGYWGEKDRVSKKEVREAYEPKHAAISLAGEPTGYPYINELIGELRKRGLTTYLVTNGQNPEKLEGAEPTQLYLSLIAYDENLYKKINLPLYRDGWQRLNRSLEILGGKKTKKVIRITLVRGYNLEHPEKFVKLIEKAEPHYIEPKGYVHVGYSRKRLERQHMPTFSEVYEFSKALGDELGYKIKDSSMDSKVVLLGLR